MSTESKYPAYSNFLTIILPSSYHHPPSSVDTINHVSFELIFNLQKLNYINPGYNSVTLFSVFTVDSGPADLK